MRAWIGGVALLVGGTALAYEEPDYEVVQTYEDFELRRYAPALVAETEVTGERGEVGNEAFRILAGYIFGKNRAREKMTMTAPVDQQPVAQSDKIAMTAPVTQTPLGPDGDRETYVFRFFMPSQYTRETLPEPEDPRVRIRELPGRLMAAHRYSGTWSTRRYREHEERLLAALARAGLEPAGEPVWARYDSPFKLWFLRRNEVLVEVVRAP